MDMDATVEPVAEDPKKGKKSSKDAKGKKKHKKEHKSSSSSSLAAKEPAKVRKRIGRTNVTRPGYGREGDDDPEDGPSTTPVGPIEPPMPSRMSGLSHITSAPVPAAVADAPPSVFEGMSLSPPSSSSPAVVDDGEPQFGILAGMQIKHEASSPLPFSPAAATSSARKPSTPPDSPAVTDRAVLASSSGSPVAAAEPVVEVPRAITPRDKRPSVPAVAPVVQPPSSPSLPPPTPAPVVATASLVDFSTPEASRRSDKNLQMLSGVFEEIADSSSPAKPTVLSAQTAPPAQAQQVASQQQQAPTRTPKRSASTTSSSSASGASSRAAKTPTSIVRPSDARAAEKEMRELMDDLQSSLASASREAENERSACAALLREKAALMRELQKLQAEMDALRERVQDCEQNEKYDEAAALDAELQRVAVHVATKERRAREVEEEVETKQRQTAVLQSKEVSVRRKGLLKLIELRRRREDANNTSVKELEEYVRERNLFLEQRTSQLDRSGAGLESDMSMLTSNRDRITATVEKATGGLRVEREGLRERFGEVEREIRELERLLREKMKIKAQVAEKISKIDNAVKDVKARYDGELGELDAALREKELRVAELDVERGAVDKARREFKDAVAAMEARMAKQKEALGSLAGIIRRVEGDIGRAERSISARDEDRDALRAIEANFMDERDVAREVRVRLEEYDFEIKEAKGRLDAIATKLAEKRTEEEDLRLSKMVRAEQEKKQAAADRNYKEAQRLRDAVAKMKARCSELEGEMEELLTQQKEHSQRVEDAIKASAEERARMVALTQERDTSRLSLVEAKVRELALIRHRRTLEMKETLASLREAAAHDGEQGGRLEEAEEDRKALTADLELLDLQVEEGLAECVLLAGRCGQPERVVAIKAIVNDQQALLEAKSAAPARPPARVDVVAATSPVSVAIAPADQAPVVLDSGVPLAAQLSSAETELEALKDQHAAAMAEDDFELAEQLDPKIERLAAKCDALRAALASQPAAAPLVAEQATAAAVGEDANDHGEPQNETAVVEEVGEEQQDEDADDAVLDEAPAEE